MKKVTYISDCGKYGLAAIDEWNKEIFFELLNDPVVLENMGDFDLRPMSSHDIENYIKAHSKDTWVLCIFESGEWVPIGYSGVFIRQRHRVGIIRTAILKKFRGKGYSIPLRMLMHYYVFEVLNLDVLHSSVMASNIGSIKMNEKLGMVQYGRARKSRISFSGKVHDEILFEMLKEEYYENKSKV